MLSGGREKSNSEMAVIIIVLNRKMSEVKKRLMSEIKDCLGDEKVSE